MAASKIFLAKVVTRFNFKAHNFQKFPGGIMLSDPLDLGAHATENLETCPKIPGAVLVIYRLIDRPVINICNTMSKN